MDVYEFMVCGIGRHLLGGFDRIIAQPPLPSNIESKNTTQAHLVIYQLASGFLNQEMILVAVSSFASPWANALINWSSE